MEQSHAPAPGGKLTISFKLSADEAQRFAERALRNLAATLKLDGFRPGKVPLDVARAKLEPSALRQERVRQAVRELYPEYVQEHGLEVLGRPEISVRSEDPLALEITAARLPGVTLGNWTKVTVSRKPVAAPAADVEQLMLELREHRAAEAAVVRPAQLGDRVELDFDVALDNVPLEGGSQKGYGAVLGKRQLVPGFEEQVVGLQPGEEKAFPLTFPADYRKDLAGKTAQVQAKLVQVFERTLPEANDEFAQGLGRFVSLADLLAKLRENLLDERREREEQRVEREMLEALLSVASFEEIPEVLVQGEVEKMLHEFREGIEQGGVEWAPYLVSIKQDEVGLRAEFQEGAAKRVKLGLLTRALAKQENLAAGEEAIEAELERALGKHGNAYPAEHLKSDGYRDYVRSILTNRRVVEWLKERLVR